MNNEFKEYLTVLFETFDKKEEEDADSSYGCFYTGMMQNDYENFIQFILLLKEKILHLQYFRGVILLMKVQNITLGIL
jgi:hypothetical protein